MSPLLQEAACGARAKADLTCCNEDYGLRRQRDSTIGILLRRPVTHMSAHLSTCAGHRHVQVEGLGKEAPVCGDGLLSDLARCISGLRTPVPGKSCSALTPFLGGISASARFVLTGSEGMQPSQPDCRCFWSLHTYSALSNAGRGHPCFTLGANGPPVPNNCPLSGAGTLLLTLHT